MNPDKYRKRQRVQPAAARVRHQIALEAARRLMAGAGSESLAEVGEADLYAAKRRAAAVLGHRVRAGDLPTDHEVREAALALRKDAESDEPEPDAPEPEIDASPIRLSDHLDRFDIYRMRLQPLESVKQNPRTHPEGDALYHCLQVFELARAERPYDEEFLLAALLHDVGKAIDPSDSIRAGLESLEGAIPDRTSRLIAGQPDVVALREGTLSSKARRELDEGDDLEDLQDLRRLDESGRVPGAPVGTLDEALDYLKGLEGEAYLDSE